MLDVITANLAHVRVVRQFSRRKAAR